MTRNTRRSIISFTLMACLLIAVGFLQSWSVMLSIFNLCLISAIMALGVNIQWGYAGLFNVGTMGFAAVGGVAAVLISKEPVTEAWSSGGWSLIIASLLLALTIILSIIGYRIIKHKGIRTAYLIATIVTGIFATRYFSDPAITDIESVNPAVTGYLGGIGLPILFSWIAGGIFAAGAAWIIGKISLGLRSDYLAIATLGISEIIVAFVKNEDWLTRGVKNVTGLPRPVPYEIDLQEMDWFFGLTEWFYSSSLKGLSPLDKSELLSSAIIEFSGIYIKLCYASLFIGVLAIILTLSVMSLNSPWGRMMRAIRDNETSAAAMGKDITGRHMQVFIIGSAVIGIAGAMLTTLDGQLTPGTYNPLRFTFLIWVMVIVGGSGNNLGSVLGGFLIWFTWIEAEPLGVWLIDHATGWLDQTNPIRLHLMDTAQHMRLFMMGLVLLLVMRFNAGGIIPEEIKHG